MHQVQKSECNLVLHIVISKHVHSEPDNQKALGIMKVKKDAEEKMDLKNDIKTEKEIDKRMKKVK